MLLAIRGWHTNPTQELTGSEIVSHEIDPVLFITLSSTDNFLAQLNNRK